MASKIMDPKMLYLIFESFDDQDTAEVINNSPAINDAEKSSTMNAAVLAALVYHKKEPLFNHRLDGFVLEDVPYYNDPTFKVHFRMERSTFQHLLDMYGGELTMRSIDPATKLLSTLWLFSNEECYRGVADRFGMSKGSLHRISMEVSTMLKNHVQEVVIWPGSADIQAKASLVGQRYGFPGAFGFVDGCHIAITGKSIHRDSFINRHGFSSIILLGVCDINLSFIHIHVGWPGSVHDARVFRNSGLGEVLQSVSNDFHLLGDSAFPLSCNLLTPYRDNGHLTSRQKKFNLIHSSARSCIERAFASLKGKFRRLKHLEMSLENSIPTVVTACVVLHNIILQQEGDGNASYSSQTAFYSYGQCDGSTKRDNIASHM